MSEHTKTPVREGAVTTRIARWSIRHPWWAISLWLAFVVASVVLGGMVETRQAEDLDYVVGESGRAARIVAGAGFDDPETESVLITPRETWDPVDARAAAEHLTTDLRAVSQVAEVGEVVASPTTDALLVPVTLSATADDHPDLTELRAALDGVAADHPGLRVETVGNVSVGQGIEETVGADLNFAGLLSVPVTLGVLLLAFGAIIAAGVPLLLALSAVAAAIGAWAYVSHLVPDIGSVRHVILLIGLAVGVDYSLFYLRREREERRRGAGTVDAVRVAAATSGRAVVVSAVTAIVALAGLYLAADTIFAALGTGVILAVAVAMVGSLTVLPALLVKLGHRVDRPRVPVLWRLTNRGGESRVWAALLRPALRAPGATLAVSLVGMAALAVPAVGMSLKSSSIEDIPRSIPVVRAYDRLVAAFPSEGNTHEVVVRAPAGDVPAVGAALADLAARTEGDPLFATGDGVAVRTSPDRTVSVLELAVPYEIDAPEVEASLAKLRDDLVPATVGALPGAEVAVGGIAAENLDYSAEQTRKLPWVIGFVLGITMLMMAIAFRSVVVALVAGLLNLVSVAGAFGLVVLVFQHSWAEGLLGFTATGHLVNWVPLFLFVVLVGLSMDYHVFVVSRIREAALAGADTREAVRQGIVRSAGVVTSAATVMVAVFAIFATLSLIEMKQLGVGLAAAIAIDATVVRIFLLPSMMALLGRANWWPSRLSRRPAERLSAARVPPRPSARVAG